MPHRSKNAFKTMAKTLTLDPKKVAKVHQAAVNSSIRYVRLFCQIMGFSTKDASFIGVKPDPFGVAILSDQFWSMTDMFYVISRLPHWIEKYGSIEAVRETVQDWYWWTIGESEKWPKKEDDKRINLDHWLMGLRPTPEDTSDEYKDMMAKELAESKKRVAELEAELKRYMEEGKADGKF
jgi:hypothetical protein